MIHISLHADFEKHMETLRPKLEEALGDLKCPQDYTLRFIPSYPIIDEGEGGSVLHYIKFTNDSDSNTVRKLGDIIVAFADEHNV